MILLLTIALVFLGGVFFFAFFSIQKIVVARQDVRVEGEEIARYAQKYIGGNIFLTSKQYVARDLQEKFPEIASVSITRQLPDTIRLTVGTHPVAFRWACERTKKELSEQGEIIEKHISELYYVNMDGRISKPTPEETEAFLIYEKSPCPDNLSLRDRILPANIVRSVFEAKSRLEEILGQKIDRSGYYRDAREIHLITENETEIWIDFATPMTEQIKKLEAALQREPSLYEPHDHIDLRISDKIFYAP